MSSNNCIDHHMFEPESLTILTTSPAISSSRAASTLLKASLFSTNLGSTQTMPYISPQGASLLYSELSQEVEKTSWSSETPKLSQVARKD